MPSVFFSQLSERFLLVTVASVLSTYPGHAQTPSPSAATGIWLGWLATGSSTLRLQLHLDPAVGACSLDSLDQGPRASAALT